MRYNPDKAARYLEVEPLNPLPAIATLAFTGAASIAILAGALTMTAPTPKPAYDVATAAAEQWRETHDPRPNVQPTIAPDPSAVLRRERDQFYLAATLWGEAREDGYQGMLAVGNVILNRISSNPDRYGYTPTQVALRTRQFSCWLPTDPNRPKLNRQYLGSLNPSSLDGQAWAQAQAIAASLLSGELQDNTNGSTHYHAKYMVPKWARKQDLIGRIAHQIFYR